MPVMVICGTTALLFAHLGVDDEEREARIINNLVEDVDVAKVGVSEETVKWTQVTANRFTQCGGLRTVSAVVVLVLGDPAPAELVLSAVEGVVQFAQVLIGGLVVAEDYGGGRQFRNRRALPRRCEVDFAGVLLSVGSGERGRRGMRFQQTAATPEGAVVMMKLANSGVST